MEENISTNNSIKNSIYLENYESKKSEKVDGANTSEIVKIIAEILTNLCEENKSNSESKLLLLKPFISKKIPSISIKDYIERLLKYSKTFNEIAIIILIYLDTICCRNKIYLNYYNIHKFIFAAFIAAVKFYQDDYYFIGYYAKLGGVSKKEAINLEYEFLILIDFKLLVNQNLYDKYYNNLKNLEDDDNDDIFDLM